jgi:hypothetical protein
VMKIEFSMVGFLDGDDWEWKQDVGFLPRVGDEVCLYSEFESERGNTYSEPQCEVTKIQWYVDCADDDGDFGTWPCVFLKIVDYNRISWDGKPEPLLKNASGKMDWFWRMAHYFGSLLLKVQSKVYRWGFHITSKSWERISPEGRRRINRLYREKCLKKRNKKGAV